MRPVGIFLILELLKTRAVFLEVPFTNCKHYAVIKLNF